MNEDDLKTFEKDAVQCLEQAIGLQIERGRFSIAASNQKQLAEMLETDVAGGSLEKVMQAYEKAAEWYTAEESKAYVLDFSFCFFFV